MVQFTPPYMGEFVSIRRVQPSDAASLYAFHQRLSLETLYSRYLRTFVPSLAEIKHLCRLKPKEGLGLVLHFQETPEILIGFAYFLIKPDEFDVADVAFLLEDGFQDRGYGKVLFHQLAHYARFYGIHQWQLDVDSANQRMLRLIQHSGYVYRSEHSNGLARIRLNLHSRSLPEEVDVRVQSTKRQKSVPTN